jgi:phage terminase large subunit GpA-like protein
MVRKWLESFQVPEKRRFFWNEVLGEPYKERGETVSWKAMFDRREQPWKSLNERVGVITLGCDVQKDRLECEVVAWGEHEESWGLEYRVFYGDPTEIHVWQMLDELLLRRYLTEHGGQMQIAGAFIDSGYLVNEVYAFTGERESRRIYASKGVGGVGVAAVNYTASRNNPMRVPLFKIGVDTCKDTMYGRMRIWEPGPGYMHFQQTDDYGQHYFEMLTAEELRTVKDKSGHAVRRWMLPGGKRNEALDCRILAWAALLNLRPDWQAIKHSLESQRGHSAAPVERDVDNRDWIDGGDNWV